MLRHVVARNELLAFDPAKQYHAHVAPVAEISTEIAAMSKDTEFKALQVSCTRDMRQNWAGGSSRRSNVVRLIVMALGLVSVAVVLLLPLPHVWKATWRAKLLDLGHIPLFAFLTLCVYWTAQRGQWFAFVLATSVAALCETAQAAVHRSADFFDFLRGVAGSLLAVVCLQAFKPIMSARRLVGYLVLAVAILAWPIADAFPKLWDAYTAYSSFPVICDFQTRWESVRWMKENMQIERVASEQSSGRWVGRMEFFSGSTRSSGAVLFPVVRDWTGYHQLCCEFYVPEDPMSILISIRDGRKVTGPLKRFDLEREYSAGDHRVCIDLEALARGEEFAPLDLSRVESFHLVLPNSDRPRTIFVRSIHLE